MDAFVEACAASPRMKKYKPPFADPDDKEVRCVLLLSEVYDLIEVHQGTLPWSEIKGINAQLSDFVAGEPVTALGAPPAGVKPPEIRSQMRGLQPDTSYVWEMKFRGPPQQRLIGVIPEKDVFVGLLFLNRKGISWDKASEAVIETYRSIIGSTPHNCITSRDPGLALSNWLDPNV